MIHFHEEQIHSSQAVRMDNGYKWRSASIGSKVLASVEFTIISSKLNLVLIENTAAGFKGISAKNSDGRQTSSDVKPG